MLRCLGFLCHWALTLNFQGQIVSRELDFKLKYGFLISAKMVRLSRNKNKTYRLNARPQMRSSDLTLAMTLNSNFEDQTWNLLYVSQNGPIATRQKANISIKIWASNGTTGFDLGHDFELEFSMSNVEMAVSALEWSDYHETKSKHWLNSRPQLWPWPWQVRCVDLTDSDQGDFRYWCTVDSSSLYPSYPLDI